MNKKVKIGIIVAASLSVVTLAGTLGLKYVSHQRELERIETERKLNELRLLQEEEDYQTFLESNDKFYPNSYLNNKDISNMTPEEVISSFKKDFAQENFTIRVDGNSAEETLSFEALDLDFDSFAKFINNAYKNQQISKEEFLGEAQVKEYTYDFLKDINMDSFEETDLFAFFSDNVIKSVDAHVVVNPANGEVSIEPEVFGTEVSIDILKEKISEALTNSETDITVSSDDYVKPQILSDDPSLADKKTKLEKIVNKEISIKLCGETTSLSKEALWKILDGSDDFVSDTELDSYVKTLKGSYDSCYFKRPFTTSFGEQIVLESGNYGWVIDAEKTKEILTSAVSSGNQTPHIEVAYSRYGQRPALHEMNNNYIEVSISGQHVWAYVNGECVLSDDIISGEVTTNNPETTTNRGVFRLSYKQLNAILRGADYEEPVTYWMPFDGGIGFHDATWREDSEFGGQTYMGNGSHGCINMRLGSAERLYNIINDEIMIIVW